MSRSPTGLYHVDPVTDTELLQIISCMNKTTWNSDPFPTRLLMSHMHAIVPISTAHCKSMFDHGGFSYFL